jgi:hypothetical protein
LPRGGTRAGRLWEVNRTRGNTWEPAPEFRNVGDRREMLGPTVPRHPCESTGEYRVTLTCNFAVLRVIIR